MESSYNKLPPRNMEREFERQSAFASKLSTRAIKYILSHTSDELVVKRMMYELKIRKGNE